MPIQSKKGRIIEVAPDFSEAIAVWMCSGFNSRSGIWNYDLKDQGVELELVHPNTGYTSLKYKNLHLDSYYSVRPWTSCEETLWKIRNKSLNKLEYVYVFPNPGDKRSVERLEDIDELLGKCLNLLKAINIRSVSMILIPSSYNELGGKAEKDILSAKRMIQFIEKWLQENDDYMDVFLVDRVGGFDPLLT